MGDLADSVDYNNDFENDDNHVLSKPQEAYNNQDYFNTSRGALGGFADSAGVKSFT